MNLCPGERTNAAVMVGPEYQHRANEGYVCKINDATRRAKTEDHVHREVERNIDASAGDLFEVGGDILFNRLVDVADSDDFANRGAVRARDELHGQDVRFLILISHDVSSLVERPSPGVGEHDEKRTAGRRPFYANTPKNLSIK